MRVDLFDFDLPPALIAERPAAPRESARLLRVAADGLADRHVGDLPELLAPGDLLVLNDTRVIPARLAGQRGAVRVTVQLHRQVGSERWRAFAKPGKRLKPGDRIAFADGFSATIAAKLEGGEVELAFDRAGPDLAAAVAAHGAMPLPPYIKRPADAQDRRDYQTMFAARDGAVAAPTAALHFTPGLVERLRAQGIGMAFVTLHVGAGTFLPVKAEDTREHRMHAERGEIDAAAAAAIARARAAGGRIVAVGTTALRILEATAAADGALSPFAGDVDIFITPGYRFRAVDRLLTNFHLPRSTLFMLVAAFSGLERMRGAYEHAIASGYRFYSYGDCCLLDRLPE